jgi:UDP-N-acetylmuramyl pentapeptide synthase
MSRTLLTGLVFSAVTIFAVLAISPAGMYPGGFNAAQAAAASEPGIAKRLDSRENELQELLMERKRILSRIVDSMKIFLESGRAGFDEYRNANIALLRAEMDLCQTRDERLEILEKIVQFNKTCEAQVERRAAEGRAPKFDVDRAKVATLEAQIELAREKLKGQSPEQ